MKAQLARFVLSLTLLLTAFASAARTTPLRGTPPERLLDLASRSHKIFVLVGVRVEGGWRAADTRIPHKAARQRQKAREAKEKLLREHPTVRRIPDRDFDIVPGFLAEVDRHALNRLLDDDDVVSIEENEGAERTLVQSTAIVGSNTANASGFDGDGRVIVIIDDGVASTHPFFGGRVLTAASACFSGNGEFDSLCPNGETTQIGVGAGEPCPAPHNCSHGTQVAGVAVGQHPTDGSFVGVAPAASILPIMVYAAKSTTPPVSEATKDDVLAALEHVDDIRQQHSIAAVNLSLRTRTQWPSRTACIDGNPLMDDAVSALHSSNIAVVAAIGNRNYSTDPNRFYAPACLTNAISVGATTDTDGIAAYGYVQPYMDFFAPGGKCLYSTEGCVMTPGEGIETSTIGNGYIESVGTSFAAPHVSGAFAILRQAAPSATIDSLESDLKNTGTFVTIPTGEQIPRINVNAALNSDNLPPTVPAAFKATGSSNSVSLEWTASTDTGTGVDYYEISRRSSRVASFEILDEVSGVGYGDTFNIAASKMYEYRIVAVDHHGNRSGAATDFAVTVAFTDDLTSSEPVSIKGEHLAQLRAAADGWREFALLTRVHASYPSATGLVYAADFSGTASSVVDALSAALNAMSLPEFSYFGVDDPATGGSIEMEHVQQLRVSMM